MIYLFVLYLIICFPEYICDHLKILRTVKSQIKEPFEIKDGGLYDKS